MVESVQAWLEELAHTQTLCQARPGLADNLVKLLDTKLQGLGTKPSAKALMDMYQALEKSTLSNHHVKALQETRFLVPAARGTIEGTDDATAAGPYLQLSYQTRLD
jgi:hypothetical protein